MNKYSDRCPDKGPSPEKAEPFDDKMHQLSLLKRDDIFATKLGYKFSDKLGKVEQDTFIGFVGNNYFKSKLKICFLRKWCPGAEFDALLRDHFCPEFQSNQYLSRIGE